MNIGILFEPQEILLANVNFPGENVKKRSVLVISKFPQNESDIFVCLPITSLLPNNQFAIKINENDMQKGYLKKQSHIQYEYCFTELKYNANSIGKVTPQFYQKIKQKISQSILDV